MNTGEPERDAGTAGELDWPDLPGLFPGFENPERWLPLLQRHAALVQAAAPRVKVSSVDPRAAVRRQYAESLEVLRVARLFSPASLLVDVGSGGGFPGLAIACVEPETAVHLVEPLRKRARLLAELARELGLANVAVHPERAEEAGRGPLRDFSPLVTARAVAPLRELLEYTAPLAAPGGYLVLPKGSGATEELCEAAAAMATLACTCEQTVPMRPEVSGLRVVVLRKTGPTPPAYPRRPGMPAKRPL
jgi:16S rRNA (guanine527-N7)-methyltransferase